MAKPARSTRKPPRPSVASERERAHGDGGPQRWLLPILEAGYSRLVPREQAPSDEDEEVLDRAALAPSPIEAAIDISVLHPGTRPAAYGPIGDTFWRDRLAEYKQRKVAARESRSVADLGEFAFGLMAMPALPGVTNWVPIGPAVVARGQALTRPAISGRVSGIAIAPGGARMYAATANGGVFRSDDGGTGWYSLMNGFDEDPTDFAATSLACGAIAIDPADPDRIYVGTGEGDTDALFALRLTNALPAYRGIGPIRSDDGGTSWSTESIALGSEALAGASFYGLAVDPADREHVIAATTRGLYERVALAPSGHEWRQRRAGNHASVVATSGGGSTRFFAAAWGGPVLTSTDGITWTAVGSGFPAPATIGRVALAAQATNPNVLYAIVASPSGGLQGIWRLDGVAGPWRTVTGMPAALLSGGQGSYDLTICVDPLDANRIYVGGDGQVSGGQWVASIYRGIVSPSGANFAVAATHVGNRAHADVHVVTTPPGDGTRLWAGTDGGLFANLDPTGAGDFEPRNTGLSSLCTNYFAQNPAEPAVIFAGLQDNGTARYVGEEAWRHVQWADGGYCVVNWADPNKILVYANGTVYRATDGGQDYGSWAVSTAPPWQIMAEPLAGTVFNPGSPAEADRVAFGAGTTVFVSSDFGATWPDSFGLPVGSAGVYTLSFATVDRMFIGTTNGRVFRADKGAAGWVLTRLDNVAGGPLPLVGLIAHAAIDWSDPARDSIYIALGGHGDRRHVWHFDGTSWVDRSGPAGIGGLMDIEHNAVVVDPDSPANIYVGADIGVWHSGDSGTTWTPLENGLPDAPVFDLQIHRQARLLRASLHGRGLYEYMLGPGTAADVELYVRDTELDTGRGVSTDGHNNPTQFPMTPVWHFLSPNIKVDVPTPAGYQTPTTAIDFLTFNETLRDGSAGVATIAPPAIVRNRVYVEVHNRGPFDADQVKVSAAITNASTALRPLPPGYTANIQAGTALPGTDWTTLGTVTLSKVRPGLPAIAEFELPSTLLSLPASLPGQSHYCLMAFVHSPADIFTATETNPDSLTLIERKVGQRNLHIVEFVGVPPPGTVPSSWAMLELGLPDGYSDRVDLSIDARSFPGALHMVVPPQLLDGTKLGRSFRRGSIDEVAAWSRGHLEVAERLFTEGEFTKHSYRHLVEAMKRVGDQPLISILSRKRPAVLSLRIQPGDRPTIFFRIDQTPHRRPEDTFSFDVIQKDQKTGVVQGGARYLIVTTTPAEKSEGLADVQSSPQ